MSEPTASPAEQALRERISTHVTAIVAAVRELRAEAAADREQFAPRDAAEPPVQVTIHGGRAAAADTRPIHLAGENCSGGTVPIFIEYECGHFLTGEPYYCRTWLCL